MRTTVNGIRSIPAGTSSVIAVPATPLCACLPKPTTTSKGVPAGMYSGASIRGQARAVTRAAPGLGMGAPGLGMGAPGTGPAAPRRAASRQRYARLARTDADRLVAIEDDAIVRRSGRCLERDRRATV